MPNTDAFVGWLLHLNIIINIVTIL